MKTVDVNAESNGYAAGFTMPNRGQKFKIKTRPDILAGRVILSGAGVVVGLVICANIAPYNKLANQTITKTLGFTAPWLGRLIGVCGLAAVQVGEIFPYTMHRPNRIAYVNAKVISIFSYAIDAAIAIKSWNPLKVPLADFLQLPIPSSISFVNIGIILVLLFGVEVFIKLWRMVGQTNRNQELAA